MEKPTITIVPSDYVRITGQVVRRGSGEHLYLIWFERWKDARRYSETTERHHPSTFQALPDHEQRAWQALAEAISLHSSPLVAIRLEDLPRIYNADDSEEL